MGWLSNLFGGGSNKTTTTTNTAPWAAAQPALQLGLNQATNLFNADPTGQKSVYTGSTVVPWSNQTQQAMAQIQRNALANAGKNGTSGFYGDIISQGGMSDPQRNAAGVLQSIIRNPTGMTAAQTQAANSAKGVMSQGGYNPAMRRALGGFQAISDNPFNSFQNQAIRNAQDTANSSFNINANPAFKDVLRQAQTDASNAVNMSAGGAGRYGSGVHQGNLASEIGDLTSRMVGQEYNNWQNRRDMANQNMFNMGQTAIGNQMSARGNIANIGQTAMGNLQNAQNSLFNMGQTGLGNRTNAAQNLYGMGQQAIGNIGTAFQGLNQPAQNLMQVGAMQEDLATRQKNDELRRFNETNQAPWDQIGRLNAIASGAGQMGGSTTQSAPGQNPFLTALGYGSSIGGLLGGFL